MKKVDENTGKEGLFSLADLKGIIDNARNKIKDIDLDCATNYSKHTLAQIKNKRRPVSDWESTIAKAQKDIENGNYSDYEENTLF